MRRIARVAAALAAVAVVVPATCRSSASPPFTARIGPVTTAELGRSWHRGCPVAPANLRRLRLAYRDFRSRRRLGTLVVSARAAHDVVAVFRRLYRARFPIRRLRPVAAYRGSDERSMAADNTSGFNCRRVAGSRRWSAHAYGEAIDVNPVENPSLRDGLVDPPSGRGYVDRSRARRGMAVEGGVLVRAFASVGWSWGGRWTGAQDYQHFSSTGG
jgi:hypothetical protein